MNISRRRMLQQSAIAAGASISLPLAASVSLAESTVLKKQKIVVVGAHPDDPESGCGGSILYFAEQGHTVTSVYFTRGEAGIQGKSHDEAAAIRTAEAEKACKILKSRPVFFHQIDGNTELNKNTYEEFLHLLEQEKPDICLAHWPIDTHRDHRAASLHAYDAWQMMGRSFALYYFEVMSGRQTQTFHPTYFIDITPFEEKKREACYCHESQKAREWYSIHEEMALFRGKEAGCRYAEAFVPQTQNPKISC
ncbi:MAG: PIG-L family deacetylase [Candidatus Omnitrophota bacterium]